MDGVRGFDEVMKNLNTQITGIKNRSMSGLLEAGLKIESASNERAPRHLGNLVGSSYARKAQDGSLSV
jgi:ferritin-like metal-binding protein YciE